MTAPAATDAADSMRVLLNFNESTKASQLDKLAPVATLSLAGVLPGKLLQAIKMLPAPSKVRL